MSYRRAVSILLLAVYLPACTSYHTTTLPVAELTAAPEAPERIRVTTADGATVEVDAPRVANDTLYGSTWTTGAGGKQSAGVMTIPIANIRTVEVRKSDGTKTLLLVGGIAAGILLLGVGGCSSSGGYGC
jgi:hypothetical protein